MGFCGRVEKDEYVSSVDIRIRSSPRIACTCVTRVSTATLSMSWKQRVLHTQAECDGERRVCTREFRRMVVSVDRFDTDINVGYYLGEAFFLFLADSPAAYTRSK